MNNDVKIGERAFSGRSRRTNGSKSRENVDDLFRPRPILGILI